MPDKKTFLIEYVRIQLPDLNDFSQESVDGFKEKIILQAQGDAIILSTKDNPIPALCLALIAAYDHCPEVVIENDEKLIQIYNHHETDGLRPSVDISLWPVLKKIKQILRSSDNNDLPSPEVVTDLSAVHAVRSDDYAKLLIGELKPAIITTLQNPTSAIDALIAAYLAKPLCHELRLLLTDSGLITLFSTLIYE